MSLIYFMYFSDIFPWRHKALHSDKLNWFHYPQEYFVCDFGQNLTNIFCIRQNSFAFWHLSPLKEWINFNFLYQKTLCSAENGPKCQKTHNNFYGRFQHTFSTLYYWLNNFILRTNSKVDVKWTKDRQYGF